MASAAHQPEEFARALAERFDLTPPINLYDLARRLGLEIREVDSEELEAALIRVPGRARGIIAVRRGTQPIGRYRFALSHEISHLLLPGHGATEAACLRDDVECWIETRSRREESANRFAAELLLPSALVRSVLSSEIMSMATAESLAAQCQTSLTAAALRCVMMDESPRALVTSVGGRIVRYKANALFRGKIAVGSVLDHYSFAKHLSDEPEGSFKHGYVHRSAWLVGEKPGANPTVYEDSVMLPAYDSVLTILTSEPLF